MAGQMRTFALPVIREPTHDDQDGMFKKLKLDPPPSIDVQLLPKDYTSTEQQARLEVLHQQAILNDQEALEYVLLAMNELDYADATKLMVRAQQTVGDEIMGRFQVLLQGSVPLQKLAVSIRDEIVSRNLTIVSASSMATLDKPKLNKSQAYISKLIADATGLVPPGGAGGGFDSDDEDGQDNLIPSVVDPSQTPGGGGAGAGTRRNLFPPPTVPPTARVDPYVENLIKQLSDIVHKGLQPLRTFVGMVVVQLSMHDVRRFYRYGQDGSAIKSGAKTVEEFIQTNGHLGNEMLGMFLKATLNKRDLLDARWSGPRTPSRNEIEPIGALISRRDQEFVDDYLRRANPSHTSSAANDWVFGSLDTAALEFVLADDCWGAIAMALSEVRRIPNCAQFELKSLMMSEGVRDMFAMLVSFAYLNSSGGGANATPGRFSTNDKGKVKGTTYNLSTGFATRLNLSYQLQGCKDWFRRVYARTNPVVEEELKSLALYDQDHEAVLSVSYLGYNFLGNDFESVSRAFASIPDAQFLESDLAMQIREAKYTRLKRVTKQVQKILVRY